MPRSNHARTRDHSRTSRVFGALATATPRPAATGPPGAALPVAVGHVRAPLRWTEPGCEPFDMALNDIWTAGGATRSSGRDDRPSRRS